MDSNPSNASGNADQCNAGFAGYWFEGRWYPYQQPTPWTFTYPYTLYPDMPAKIIDQLLKRIADLEALTGAKENNGTNRS